MDSYTKQKTNNNNNKKYINNFHFIVNYKMADDCFFFWTISSATWNPWVWLAENVCTDLMYILN